jgi:PilZ domain
MERRKHPRYRVEYVIQLLGERSHGQGLVQDLSVMGCRARSPVGITKGVSIGMLIDVPRYENPLHVDMAIIRWAKEEEFGMEFVSVTPDNQQRLQEVIRTNETNRMSDG